MRIEIIETVRVGHQTLNPGVCVDLPDEIAEQLVAERSAKTAGSTAGKAGGGKKAQAKTAEG